MGRMAGLWQRDGSSTSSQSLTVYFSALGGPTFCGNKKIKYEPDMVVAHSYDPST